MLPSSPTAKMQRLVDRLFEGRLLPFLGAGVSLDAKHETDCSFKPRLNDMKEALAKAICERIGNEPTQCLKDLLPWEIPGNDSQSWEQYPFSWLADIGHWLLGPRGLCEAVGIPKFRGLNPRPAHRYLAYLVREGLLSEIITTNYDGCIERAFRAGFGSRPDVCNRRRSEQALKTIHNLEGYREHAGLRQTEDGEPVLRLYKINGCADAYAAGKQAPEAIILTERQLQQFGERRWARDMLADRARRSALLFCGFSSEEPQVRHTALTIIDEFRNNGSDPKRAPHDVAELPNAPLIVVHQAISFTQAQILMAFHQAHGDATEAGAGAHGINERLSASTLSRDDAKAWDDLPKDQQGETCLTADIFFERLYQAAMGERLRRLLKRDEAFYVWLRQYTPHPGYWCAKLESVFGSGSNLLHGMNIQSKFDAVDDQSDDGVVKGFKLGEA